jgi:peptide/nickel transport system substrate-binding protein
MTKFKSLLIMLLTATLLLAGCGTSAGGSETTEKTEKNPTEETKNGGIFTIARSSDAEHIDPGYAWSEGDIDIVFHVYDGLVQFKNDKLEVEPALATEWNVSEDGKTWTFDLRKDVVFHDGTEFNANAVVQSFKRVTDENNKYYGVVKGGYSYLNYLMGDVIKDVVAVDDYQVEITLNEKFAPFLTYMGYYSQFIVSPAALDAHGENFPQNPVGTGPFVFDKWKKGEYVQLKANENYWGEKPSIDTLIFKVVPESSTRLMELQSGQVDVIKSIDPGQIATIQNNKDMELQSVPGANLFYVSINTTKAPFDNVKVRQALNHAVNKDQIVDAIYEGNGTKAINALPPTIFSFDDTAGPYEYNPEKAKELLAEAGYPDGIDLTLNTFQYARTYVSKPVQVAEVLAADLRKVGINVQIVTNEWAAHSDIMNSMTYDLGLSGWYDVPYPSNFLKTMALEGGNTGYTPQDLIDLAQAALATYDRAEQEALYKELQQKLHAGAPMIPIAHNNYTAAVRSNIKGFELDVIGTVRAHKVVKE